MSALDWLVRTSWQAAALAVVVLLLQRVLGARLTPRWRHALWWIVVLRLVLPPISLPGVDVTGEMPWEAVAPPPAYVAPVVLETEIEAAEAPFVAPVEVPPVARPADPPVAAPPPVPPPAPPEVPDFREVALVAWLAVAAGLVLISLITGARTVRRLMRGRVLDDPDLRRLVADCAAEAGIRRRITARESRDVEVPTLIGIFRPRLLLPPSALRELSPVELRYVIHHELEHVRHHDLAVNWLLHLVACLHWMNPFAWFAVGRLRTERESVRDLGVLDRTPETSGREFGRTILRVLTFAARAPRAPAHVALLEPGRDLKRRITMLALSDRPRRGGVLIGGLLVLLLVVGATVLASDPAPAVAGEEAGPAKDRPRVLVTSFSSTGDLLEKEKNLDRSLETLAEAILAETRSTVSATDLAEACRGLGRRPEDLAGSADLRLAAAKALGARQCLTGWACSFGERVVLVLETIDVGKGLPGTVRRVSCDGLEGIPDAMRKLLLDLPEPKAEKPEAKRPGPEEPGSEESGREESGGEWPRADPVPAKLAEVLARLPEDDLAETYPDEAWRTVIALRDGKRADVSVERAEQLLAKALEHRRRLREDSRYWDEWVVRTNVRQDPRFKNHEHSVVSRPPFLVFAAKPVTDARAAERVADVLSRLHAELHDLVGKPNGLDPAGGVLKVCLTTKELHKSRSGISLPDGVLSYYSARDGWLFLFLDTSEKDRDPALRRLVHEATHQVMHALAKQGVERKTGKPVVWADQVLRSRLLWLQEGLAEFMAGAMLPGGKGFDFSRPNPVRRREWRSVRKRKGADWPLHRLIAVRWTPDLQRYAAQLAPDPRESASLASLFYAQSWSFTFFLWHAEDGKYRDRLKELFPGEVTGNSGLAAWQDRWFGTGKPEDLFPLEKEWRAWEEAQSKGK